MSGQGGVPLAAFGVRAAATCGLKFRDPKAKDLKVGGGFSIGLGIFSIEVGETTTWPEVYGGVGLVLVLKQKCHIHQAYPHHYFNRGEYV